MTVDYVNKLIEDQFGQEHLLNTENIKNTFLCVFARRAKGYKLNEYGLFRKEKNVAGKDEKTIYEK